MTAPARTLLVLVGLSLSIGCSSGLDEYRCASAADCQSGGTSGFCEDNALCSFGDSTCPDGRRYGSAAGSLSNECVIESDEPDGAAVSPPADASVSDARKVPTNLDSGATPGCNFNLELNIIAVAESKNLGETTVVLDNQTIGTCVPEQGAPFLMASCDFCMDGGGKVRLEFDSSLFQSSGTCNPVCMGNNTCGFSVTQSCEVSLNFSPL